MIYTDHNEKEHKVEVIEYFDDETALVNFKDKNITLTVSFGDLKEEGPKMLTASDYLCKNDIACSAPRNLTVVAKALAAEHGWNFERNSHGYNNSTTKFEEGNLNTAFSVLSMQKEMF